MGNDSALDSMKKTVFERLYTIVQERFSKLHSARRLKMSNDNETNKPNDVDCPETVSHALSNASPDFWRELQKAEQQLVADISVGLRQASDQTLASTNAARAINRRLAETEVMVAFDSIDFRNYLLLAWQDMANGLSGEECEQFEQACEALGDEDLHVASEISSDFVQLVCDHDRIQSVRDAVNTFLKVRECGKALKVVRTNASFLDAADSAELRANCWHCLSQIDTRFREIALAYSELSDQDYRFRMDAKDHDYTVTKENPLLEDVSIGLEQARSGEIDSPRRLAAVEGMKHFHHSEFREYLLLSWKNMGKTLDAEETDSIISRWESLSPEAKRIADELTGDFGQVFSLHSTTEVEKLVEDCVKENQCGKALKIVRTNAATLQAGTVASLRSRIWKRVSEIDNRFVAISASYEEIARQHDSNAASE